MNVLLKKSLGVGLSLLFLLSGVSGALAQSGEAGSVYNPDITQINKYRYTFLWDVTLSMYGKRLDGGHLQPARYDKDIYDKVETALIRQIQNLDDPTAEIVVVPFQEHALVAGQLSEWRAPATAEGRAKLIGKIKGSKQIFQDNIVLKNTMFPQSGAGTNILGSLQWVTNNVFDDRIDVLFLLTDGGQGSGDVNTSKKDLENYLNSEWADFAKEHNVHGFYLTLTETAQKAVPEIKSDTPIVVVPSLDLNFPVPTQIKIDARKTLNVNDDYNIDSFSVAYQLVNGELPSGSRIELSTDCDFIQLKGEAVFEDRQITIPFRFVGTQSDLKSRLPEEQVVDIKFTYSCDDKNQQDVTAVSPLVFKLKIINKLQPTISFSWK